MSIAETDTIDAMGIDPETGVVTLLISDHLDWDNPGIHLLILQDKINAYLVFHQSGQLAEAFPDYDLEQLGFAISVRQRVPVPDTALPGLRALATQLAPVSCNLVVEGADGTSYDIS